MIKIYSKINNKLLHIVYRMEDTDSRLDIAPQEEFLQLATMKMNSGKTFKPHKHKIKKGEEVTIAQESWVIMRGKVKAIFYDIDDKIIQTHILNQGDCSMTFYGGHNYEILEDQTIIYEFKTGPYKGQELDKEFIND